MVPVLMLDMLSGVRFAGGCRAPVLPDELVVRGGLSSFNVATSVKVKFVGKVMERFHAYW